MKYKDFADVFLVAAYNESRLKPGETLSSGDIIERYPLVFEPGWVVQLVRDLGIRGYLTSKGVDADDRGQPIKLTGRGLRVAEDLKERGIGILRLDLGDGIGFPPEEQTVDETPRERPSGTFSDFAERMSIALYQETERGEKDYHAFGDLIDRYQLDWSESWIDRLADEWEDGFAKDINRFHAPTRRDWSAKISAQGMREIEDRFGGKDGVGTILEPRSTVTAGSHDTSTNGAPASDRIVRFDHNHPEYQAIRAGIIEVQEAVRGANDLEIEERDRLVAGLSAAETLWQAAELKLIQVKIGIILAVEEAGKALKTTAQAVAASLLVDAIKAFIKSQTGIDLDHF